MATEVASGVVQQRLAFSKVVYLTEPSILVDTGPADEWDTLRSFLEGRGGVEALFLSHDHGDHVGNAERVVDAFDPEVYVPAAEPFEDLNLGDASVTEVADGDELADGVRVVAVPGHTPGICTLYLPDAATLLSTDVLDGADRRGLPSGYLLPPPAAYNWDSEAAETNLEKLLDLEFERAVVTHGSNVTEDARQKLERYLDFQNHYRQDLLDSQS
ncbi:MBL fold metallo-hydrolase [Halobacteriales archaeon Cl-PHB]